MLEISEFIEYSDEFWDKRKQYFEIFKSETIADVCSPKYRSECYLSTCICLSFLLIIMIVGDETHYSGRTGGRVLSPVDQRI